MHYFHSRQKKIISNHRRRIPDKIKDHYLKYAITTKAKVKERNKFSFQLTEKDFK